MDDQDTADLLSFLLVGVTVAVVVAEAFVTRPKKPETEVKN